jgi:hypothetical protein
VAVIEWLDPLMLAGHWVPESIQAAGGVALGPKPGEPSRYASWDDVRRLAPEAVIVAPCGFDLERTAREAEAVASELSALARRILLMDGNAYLNRPGPRIVEAIERMAAWLGDTETSHQEQRIVEHHPESRSRRAIGAARAVPARLQGERFGEEGVPLAGGLERVDEDRAPVHARFQCLPGSDRERPQLQHRRLETRGRAEIDPGLGSGHPSRRGTGVPLGRGPHRPAEVGSLGREQGDGGGVLSAAGWRQNPAKGFGPSFASTLRDLSRRRRRSASWDGRTLPSQ